MATLPAEQVTQRNSKCTVAYSAGDPELAGRVQWLTTTTLPYTVVNTTSVSASYDTAAEIEADMAAMDEAASTPVDLHADYGYGDDVSGNTLVKVGDTTLAAANSVTTTKDISPFVAGGFGTLNYAIDDSSVIDLAGASATMAGDTLLYTAGATDGTDTVVVAVTDDTGQSVLVTVAVTVA
jgi:hypothetical protein